ncbi:MAG: phosphate regulon sensor histidine kinase PhoR [Gammaproteobacteria bacterium RBG_16_57_12]|nr:MAG: phosphate regulon sensor histidine kinase PhoR [Gammaproteobacteria bacterium RBG_16_57_12]
MLALFLGAMIGHILLLLWLATLGYLFWHLRHVFRLEKWLSEMKAFQPSEGGGIWGEIYYHLYRQQERYRGRKRRLTGFLTRFQELIKAMPDATVVLNTAGEIEWFNDAAEQLLGLRSQDRGQRIENLIRYPAFTTYLQQGNYQEPLAMRSPEWHDMHLSMLIVPYGLEQRLLLARDVTRIHRLEETRRDFVANVSHELRTPLTVINGMVENIADVMAEHPDAHLQRSIDLVQEQARHMTRLVEDLLTLSRLETSQPSAINGVVNVPQMLQQIGDEARALSGARGHDITLMVEESLHLKGDEGQLRSAFSNLISNAVRYTPPGGRIAVRWYQDASGAHFEVADTGIGIAPQHVPRLTERFYRVDSGRSRESGGTGLGLAIVKHILELHDARLSIESTPGKGSTFACHFGLVRVAHPT